MTCVVDRKLFYFYWSMLYKTNLMTLYIINLYIKYLINILISRLINILVYLMHVCFGFIIIVLHFNLTFFLIIERFKYNILSIFSRREYPSIFLRVSGMKIYSYSVVHKRTLSRFSSYSLYIFPYLVFTFYHISTHTHVRFRRACHFVFVWLLQYARRSKCDSSYVRHTLVVGGTRATGVSDRIAHGETTRLGYNANAPATIAPTGRATGRWPYQMLNGQHNATCIHRYRGRKQDCRRIGRGRTLLLPSRNV